jgi:D-alanine-D-alanine ligase
MNADLRIEIVASTQSGLGPMIRKSREAVLAVLAKHYARVKITIVNDLADLEALVRRRPDLVFLGMKLVLADQSLGLRDPAKIWVGQYLDEHGIAYTGSNHLAHQLEINKAVAKRRAQAAGLKTSPFYVIDKNQRSAVKDMPLKFPVFIKPTSRGAGQGIDSRSVANNHLELQSKVRSLAIELHSDSLVEEYLPGREFSVAILKDGASADFSVMPIELIAPPDEHGARLLSAKVKTADTELSIEVKDGIIKSEVCELAIDIFHALGARDYGRIDIRLDESGTPHFLEANLMPSLKRSDGNYFPKACALNLDLDYEQMILNIIKPGLARAQRPDESMAGHDPAEILPTLEPAF